MKFDNRPPIALEDSEIVAEAVRDGGVYDGCGINAYRVYRGTRLHLVHTYSSGCDRGGHTDHQCEHLGHWQTVEEIGEWLRGREERVEFVDDRYQFPWWASELMEHLEIPAEEA